MAACNLCGTVENLQRCGRCRAVYYCGVDHQRADWASHQQTCKFVPQEIYQPPVPDHNALLAQQAQMAAAGVDPTLMMRQEMQKHQSAMQKQQPVMQYDNRYQQEDPSDVAYDAPSNQVSNEADHTAAYEAAPAHQVAYDGSAQSEQETYETVIDHKVANQTTLDGREIYQDPSSEPGKFSMEHLPRAGANTTMAETKIITNTVKRQQSPLQRKSPPKKRKVEVASYEEAYEPENERRKKPSKKGRRKKKVIEDEPALGVADHTIYADDSTSTSMPPPPPVANVDDVVEQTTWNTNLGVVVLRGDKGYYGAGPNFEWQTANKYLQDVQTKHHAVSRRRGKNANKGPFTEIWGKWKWNPAVFGPNNEGKFKLRMTDDTFKGTWGWGSRNRGGGVWTGERVITDEDLAAEKGAVGDVEQVGLDIQLCHAAVGGEHETVEELVEKGANVNNTVVENCTPIIHAVVMNHPKVIEELLKHPRVYVEINATDQHGSTPMHISAEHGHFECANIIVKHAMDFGKKLQALLSSNHIMFPFPWFCQELGTFACPLDLDVKDQHGRKVLDITFAPSTARKLNSSRKAIKSLVNAQLKLLKRHIAPCRSTFGNSGYYEAAPVVQVTAKNDTEHPSMALPAQKHHSEPGGGSPKEDAAAVVEEASSSEILAQS